MQKLSMLVFVLAASSVSFVVRAASVHTPLPADNTVRYVVPTKDFPTGLDTRTVVPPVPEHEHGNMRNTTRKMPSMRASSKQKNMIPDSHNHLPVKAVHGTPISSSRHILHSMEKDK